jgi:site-specific DNA-methyltransferase (adenine-specific)
MSIQLLQGDCLDVMKDISANSVDCFLVDLPYGCLTGGGQEKKKRRFMNGKDTGTEIIQKEGTIAGCSWDVKIDLEKFWEQVKRLAKNDHTPVLMFCNTKFGYDLIKSNESWFRYDLVWDKERGVSFLSANKMPMKSHEMIYVFSKKGAYYNRVDVKGDFTAWKSNKSKENKHSTTYSSGMPNGWKDNGNNGTTRCVTSVIKMKKVGTFKQAHPTEKPVELYKWLIERYCPVGGTILDPTAGSCNSCFAGYELGRNCIGIEKDKGFFETARKKLEGVDGLDR